MSGHDSDKSEDRSHAGLVERSKGRLRAVAPGDLAPKCDVVVLQAAPLQLPIYVERVRLYDGEDFGLVVARTLASEFAWSERKAGKKRSCILGTLWSLTCCNSLCNFKASLNLDLSEFDLAVLSQRVRSPQERLLTFIYGSCFHVLQAELPISFAVAQQGVGADFTSSGFGLLSVATRFFQAKFDWTSRLKNFCLCLKEQVTSRSLTEILSQKAVGY
ncbi:hypothetical protein C8R43DRAFT_956419 [Mycena crocata]|nr:hypothetical protein C8R43DRAFT_956419 [Mycena crocata]